MEAADKWNIWDGKSNWELEIFKERWKKWIKTHSSSLESPVDCEKLNW